MHAIIDIFYSFLLPNFMQIHAFSRSLDHANILVVVQHPFPPVLYKYFTHPNILPFLPHLSLFISYPCHSQNSSS
jgi:hypothetical protein